MHRPWPSDVVKILLYAAAALALGAALAPLLFNFGKGLAEVTGHKQTNGFIAWLARLADRSAFPHYYNVSLLLSAAALALPTLGWLRLGNPPGGYRDTPWSLTLPPHAVAPQKGQPLRKNPHGIWQLATGLVLAAGLLLASGWLLTRAGCFIWRDAPASAGGVPNPFPVAAIEWAPLLRASLAKALFIALLAEVLFRGVMLGIFLRAMRALPAVAAVALLFSLVPLLIAPATAEVPDPEAKNAGFLLLRKLFSGETDPLSLLVRFPTLFAMGLMLGAARFRTASLWLPIGLHAGWLCGSLIFSAVTWPTPGLPDPVRWLAGTTMLDGLLPLVMVLVTGFFVLPMARSEEEEPNP